MHKANRRTIFKALLVLVVATIVGGTFWLAFDWVDERRTQALVDTHIREIVGMLDLGGLPDFHDRIDKVRTFINDHSEHEIDDEFFANRKNRARFAAGVLDHAKGLAADPVNMECSTRSNLMRDILHALGHQTRTIAIFDSHSNLKSHSFLEVLNPTTGKWETQDADYDLYWRSRESGERVALADKAEHLEAIEPCGRNFCGWQSASREGMKPEKLKAYLDIVSITEKGREIRYALYTSRTDLNRIYQKDGEEGLFCEVEEKRCKHGFFNISQYREIR